MANDGEWAMDRSMSEDRFPALHIGFSPVRLSVEEKERYFALHHSSRQAQVEMLSSNGSSASATNAPNDGDDDDDNDDDGSTDPRQRPLPRAVPAVYEHWTVPRDLALAPASSSSRRRGAGADGTADAQSSSSTLDSRRNANANVNANDDDDVDDVTADADPYASAAAGSNEPDVIASTPNTTAPRPFSSSAKSAPSTSSSSSSSTASSSSASRGAPSASASSRSYTIDLAQLTPASLTLHERRCIASIVACSLPRAWSIVSTTTRTGGHGSHTGSPDHPSRRQSFSQSQSQSHAVPTSMHLPSPSSSSSSSLSSSTLTMSSLQPTPPPTSLTGDDDGDDGGDGVYDRSSRADADIDAAHRASSSHVSNPVFAPIAWQCRYVETLVHYFELDPMVVVSVRSLLLAAQSPEPFWESLRWTSLVDRARLLLVLLHFSVVTYRSYDARVRVMLRSLARFTGVRWAWFTRQENSYATLIRASLPDDKPGARKSSGRWWKVGLAAIGGGALLAVTGGLAAPAIGLGLTSLGLTSIGGAGAAVGAALTGSAGVVLFTTMFGLAGAGLAGYKMNRRVDGLEQFEFEKLCAANSSSMHVILCINGWLNSLDDYHSVWQFMVRDRYIPQQRLVSEDDDDDDYDGADRDACARSRDRARTAAAMAAAAGAGAASARRPGFAQEAEVYTLRWVSDHLLNYGNGLRDITSKEIAGLVVTQGLQHTLLQGLIMAVAWPAMLLKVADVIDNPWSMVLNRADKAAMELADVLERRVHGNRPITLVGYSFGARVIFRALEELHARKIRRLAQQQQSHSSSQHSSHNSHWTTGGAKKGGGNSGSRHTPSPPTSNNTKQTTTAGESNASDLDGIVVDVFLFGTPVSAKAVRWARVRSMVSGRVVNGFCRGDWVLNFIYSMSSMSRNVAGLVPIPDVMGGAPEGPPEVSGDVYPGQVRVAAPVVVAPVPVAIPVAVPVAVPVGSAPGSSSSSAAASSSAASSSSSSTAVRAVRSRASALGLVRVNDAGIENVDLTTILGGHTHYPDAIEFLLGLVHMQP